MSIHPTLRYDDPRAAIAFLTGALGFVEEHVSTADDGRVGHAELSFGGRRAHAGHPAPARPDTFDTGRAVDLPGRRRPSTRTTTAPSRPAPTVVQDLVDQPYGSREYAVRDPEGNIWSSAPTGPR